MLNKQFQPQTPPHHHRPPPPHPQTDVFELTTTDENQLGYGHLKEFILHSDSEVSNQQQPPTRQSPTDQLLEHEIQEDTAELYHLEFDSDDDGEEEDGDGDEGKKQQQQQHHVTFASAVESKKQTMKGKKKKLLRWNPEPCSECQRSFRGEGE
jgi:hypothetical protein